MIGEEELDRRCDHHVPDPSTAALHGLVRRSIKSTMRDLDQLCPQGREKSLALTKLEEAMMWANAAIAREAAT